MRRRLFIPLCLIASLLIQCSRLSLNEVSVVGRNFADVVQQTQNLTFTFNKNIGPERQTGAWDSTQYIRFVPAVRGKFKWATPSELVFSPARSFDPATDYRAELTDNLLTGSDKKNLNVSGDDINFHTPYLQLTGTETWWTRSRETGQPVAKSRLNFNYPVSSAEVTGKLTVSSADKALTAQPSPTDAQNILALTLPNAPALKNGQPLTVKIDRGIKVPNTSYVSKDPIEETTVLPSRYNLEITDVQTSFENAQGVVRVITTQELQPIQNAGQNPYYTIQPAVETTTELTENGFIIRGNFTETDTYVLTLTDQIRGVLNTKLDEPVTRDLFFGKMPASIQFATKKALYLSSKGAQNIGLNIVNVPKVQVKIAKVYENNILHYLRSNRYEEYNENAAGEWGPSGAYSYGSDESGNLSDVITDKTVETVNLPKVRGVSALNLALPDPGNKFRGVYLVSVGSKDEAYLQANQLVSLSDIGLVARQTNDEVLVWANSIYTAEPMQGVDITLVSSNNQSVYTLKTDGSGFAKFDKVSEKAPGFTVALLTARTDDDFNFLFLPDTQVETSRFAVEGKRDNESGLTAMVYGDRDIYRPGETIHFNTIIRSASWQPMSEIPVIIRVLMPNGREAQAFRKTTNAQGAVTTDVPLNPAAVTGSYTIEVLNANNVLLISQPVSVEEFVPDRIKVDVLLDKQSDGSRSDVSASYKAGETLTVSATAMNLFGPPASDRAYEMEFQLKRKVFAPTDYGQYDFTIPNGVAPSAGTSDEPGSRADAFPKEVRQGRTNASGQANERFPISALYQDIGLLEGKLFVTVFDENGRPVNRLRRFDILTQDTFFGIRLPDRYVATNAPVAVELVALDPTGTARSQATALVEVVRYDYQTVIEKKNEGGNDSQVKYITKRREKSVYTNSLSFKNGIASFRYVPTVSGEYEIRVRRPGALVGGYAATKFYAYGYGSTSASSFDVSQEGQVLITLDKPVYQTGDKAKVLFKAPFDGKLLVTVERNRVLEQHWLTTNNKSVEWSFSVSNDHLPNVYVTATLIRAMDVEGGSQNLPLTVAHGVVPVTVQATDTKLPVTLTAVPHSRSKTKQRIRVKTARNAQVTVAVVDEGILQIKNFKTPDPHGFFYQKRALEVGSHDLYALLYPELSLKSRSSTGGDGYDLERRVNPLSNGRVKLVALWSGILETNSSGEAEFTVDIPQFSGDLRIMAVAYKGNAFGSANGNMKVSDPIVISAGVPRFLTPGDQLDLPVNLSNTTKQPAIVTAQINLTGPLATDSIATQKLTIQPGRETRAIFQVAAKQAIGAGTITITVKGLNETFSEKTDITVRPAASLQKITQSGAVAGGKSEVLQPVAAFLPGTARTNITLSRSPVAQYGRELSYLLGYPHGCIEQTISKAFPQLYFADLAKQVQANTYFVRAGDSDLNPATNVRRAILAVEGLQTPDGGYTMWPGFVGSGRLEVDPWATAYAVHFLTEAQQAGYDVRASGLSTAIDFLTTFSSNPATENDVAVTAVGERTVRKVASRTSIYSLYVLANAGKPNRSAMNYYKQNASLLTSDSRYLLASTFYRIGDTRSFSTLLPKKFTDNTSSRQTGGSYASPLRNLALVLNALVDTDRDNLQIPVLARQLSNALKQTNYLNTQEAAFAFLSLGKLARQTANSTATATLTASGKVLGTMNNSLLNLKRIPSNTPLTIQAGGTGNAYYFLQSEGIPASGRIAEEDNVLRVRRDYLDRDGNPQKTIKQNDLIVVKVTLSSTNGLTIDNVVITDLLPAGFEVENPRLSEPRDIPWIKKPTTPDYFDLRDDRINFYTTASGTERTFYYLARAVSKGRFVVGPVSADAMYNGEYRSYNGAGVVTIR